MGLSLSSQQESKPSTKTEGLTRRRDAQTAERKRKEKRRLERMKEYFRVPNSVFSLNLTSCELLVLVYIYRCINNSEAHPSYSTIAGCCHINRRTAIRTLSILESKGKVIIEHHSRKSNTYLVV